MGIDRSVVDADFVVEMGAGAASAFADVADGVSAVDVLARDAGEAAQVAVTGGDAMAVIDDDGASVAAHEVGEHDHAVRRGHHRLAVSGSDINAAMESAFSVEWIDALAKTSRNGTFHRPEIGSGVCPQPIGGSRLTSEAERNAGHGGAVQCRSFERSHWSKEETTCALPMFSDDAVTMLGSDLRP